MIPLYEWQIIDKDNKLVMPWLVHNSLHWMKKQNWGNKIVWEYGAGMGDAWLANKCKKLYVVERFEDWIIKASEICAQLSIYNVEYSFRPCNDCSGMEDMYCAIPKGVNPDVIIIDDAYRYECIINAIEYQKIANKPVTLIVDNYMQSYVFMCPSADEALKPYKGELFEQADHTENDGINKWKTGIWILE